MHKRSLNLVLKSAVRTYQRQQQSYHPSLNWWVWGSWLKIGASKVLFSTDNHKHLIYVNELPLSKDPWSSAAFFKTIFWLDFLFMITVSSQTDGQQAAVLSHTLCIQIEIQLMDFPWIVHHRITKNWPNYLLPRFFEFEDKLKGIFIVSITFYAIKLWVISQEIRK